MRSPAVPPETNETDLLSEPHAGIAECALLALAVFAFYFVPWSPFLVGAFYFELVWLKLVCAAVAGGGPIAQAILLAHFCGSD